MPKAKNKKVSYFRINKEVAYFVIFMIVGIGMVVGIYLTQRRQSVDAGAYYYSHWCPNGTTWSPARNRCYSPHGRGG